MVHGATPSTKTSLALEIVEASGAAVGEPCDVWLRSLSLARRPRSRSSVSLSSHGAHAETAVGRARIDVDWRFFVFKKMRWNVRILTISIQNLGIIN